MALIVIDAGHGGFDNGAMYQGRKEKDDNLRLALAVGDMLKQRGYDVIFMRKPRLPMKPGRIILSLFTGTPGKMTILTMVCRHWFSTKVPRQCPWQSLSRESL